MKTSHTTPLPEVVEPWDRVCQASTTFPSWSTSRTVYPSGLCPRPATHFPGPAPQTSRPSVCCGTNLSTYLPFLSPSLSSFSLLPSFLSSPLFLFPPFFLYTFPPLLFSSFSCSTETTTRSDSHWLLWLTTALGRVLSPPKSTPTLFGPMLERHDEFSVVPGPEAKVDTPTPTVLEGKDLKHSSVSPAPRDRPIPVFHHSPKRRT